MGSMGTAFVKDSFMEANVKTLLQWQKELQWREMAYHRVIYSSSALLFLSSSLSCPISSMSLACASAQIMSLISLGNRLSWTPSTASNSSSNNPPMNPLCQKIITSKSFSK